MFSTKWIILVYNFFHIFFILVRSYKFLHVYIFIIYDI